MTDRIVMQKFDDTFTDYWDNEHEVFVVYYGNGESHYESSYDAEIVDFDGKVYKCVLFDVSYDYDKQCWVLRYKKRNKVYVWLVRQTQPSSDYDQQTIAVYDNKDDAYNLARRLNKGYGANCVFDEDWDFVEYDMQGDPHYYDVDCQAVNPDPNDYLWAIDE